MSDPASAAQQQQARQEGLLISLVTLPFRLIGVLGGTLLLGLVIECAGMIWLWPEQGWRHAQEMLNFELEQFSEDFQRSALVQEPGRTLQLLLTQAHEWLFVRSGLEDWSAQLRGPKPGTHQDLLGYLSQSYVYLENFLMAAAHVVLVFLVRLSVLCLSTPLFIIAAFVGLIDGLVQRDIRRFGAGRESGFIYHRARATLMPLAVLPWVIYLSLPVSVSPLVVLVPAALLLGLAIKITAASFKKYL